MKITYQGEFEMPLNSGIADLYDTDTGCKILISVDNGKQHLSISHNNRKPTEEEINKVRKELLPQEKQFKLQSSTLQNKYCCHLWEVTDQTIN